MYKLLAKALSQDEQEKLIETKLKWILSQTHPLEVLLFGSAASYQMTDSSDIDLIVIFRTREERDQSRQSLFQSRPKNDWPHDLLLMTIEEFNKSMANGGGAAYLARKEGRTLYKDEE